MKVSGNLPPSPNINGAAEFFDGINNVTVPISPNVNDAVIGFFESITGNRQSGVTLAGAILYTASSRGLDPIALIDELKQLKSGKFKEELKPIDAALFNSNFDSYSNLLENLSEFGIGQLFYNPTLNVFYQKQYSNITQQESLVTVADYRAERIATITGEVLYNYFTVKQVREENELSAYLTMLLNFDRVNTSLLGISNQPQTNKYIKRAILP